MKVGILKERKSPPDYRVPLTPIQLKKLQKEYGEVTFLVESYAKRAFADKEYEVQGIKVVKDVSHCDVLLGVKEVPLENLWSGKTYFFFSHTIKEQPYNRKLLQTVLQRNIRLIDYECIRQNGGRIIGFGRYAGIVGAYNALLAYGVRTGKYQLKPAYKCFDLQAIVQQLKTYQYPKKVVITGSGLVSQGVKEILNRAGYKEIDAQSFAKNKNALSFLCLDYHNYNERKNDGGFNNAEFAKHPNRYINTFSKYLQIADCIIFGHYWAEGAPSFFKPKDLQHKNLCTKVIADISCDIAGPVPTTIRASSIEKPLYGVDKYTLKETTPFAQNAITVMAVDNLPCEVPRDASDGFGNALLTEILPKYIDNAKNEIIANATIAENGKLTPPFRYLQNYVRI